MYIYAVITLKNTIDLKKVNFKTKEDLDFFKMKRAEMQILEEALESSMKKYEDTGEDKFKKSSETAEIEYIKYKKVFKDTFNISYDEIKNISDSNLVLDGEDIEREKVKTKTESKNKKVTPTKKSVKVISENIPMEENMSEIDVPFDYVNLPSRGKIGPYKKSQVAVTYLTAEDEDIIASPNLYLQDKVIEYLIKKKVIANDFDVMNLPQGDIDAIILWLRMTSYGKMYPMTVRDNETGKNFNTEFDLSTIEYYDFDLESDDDGYFDFECPISKDKIKFKYLTVSENAEYIKSLKEESNNVKKERLSQINISLASYLEEDNQIDENVRNNITQGMEAIETWSSQLKGEELKVNSYITTNLKYHIVSVNGKTGENYIEKYANKMLAADSLALRKYIKQNEPGVNFNIKLQRPEALGGGFVTSFLELDAFIFSDFS